MWVTAIIVRFIQDPCYYVHLPSYVGDCYNSEIHTRCRDRNSEFPFYVNRYMNCDEPGVPGVNCKYIDVIRV